MTTTYCQYIKEVVRIFVRAIVERDSNVTIVFTVVDAHTPVRNISYLRPHNTGGVDSIWFLVSVTATPIVELTVR